jgi:outer membrane protein
MADRIPLLLAVTIVAAPAMLAGQSPRRLSFRDAVAQAAAGAPLVSLAGFGSDAARAELRQTRAALLPDLSAGAGWLNQTLNRDAFGIKFPSGPGFPSGKLVGPFDLYDARLHLTQTLFDYAGVIRVRAAHAVVAGAAADSGASVEAAAGAVAMAYLQAARARAVVSARVADSTLAAELVDLARAQQQAGVGTRIDVTRAETQLVTAEGGLVVARDRLVGWRIAVALALGESPDAPLRLADTLTATLPVADLPTDRDSLVALALRRRPDLAAERARGLAAGQRRAAIAAERLPRLDLSASYGASGLSPTDGVGTRQVGVQISIPILDGFRREGREAEQRVAAQASAVRAADLERRIAADVDNARLRLHSAQARTAIAAEQLRLAQDELSQARDRFTAGITGNIDVIEAQVSLIRARDGDIDARFTAASARVALARAVGLARTLH